MRAESAALPPGEDPLPVVARTDKDGAFTLGPFAAGSYRVTAARAGYVLRRAPTVTFGARDGSSSASTPREASRRPSSSSSCAGRG